MLTQWDIEEIQQKMKQASVGPWEQGKVPHALVSKNKPEILSMQGQEEKEHLDVYGGYAIAEHLTPHDLEFICMAKKMIPRLIDHIDEQEDIVKNIKSLYKSARGLLELLNDERVRVRLDMLKDYSAAYAQLMEAIDSCHDIEWDGKDI